MSIPVIVITHGCSGAALCDTVQMIIGEQQQLFSLDFLPGENVESILHKINALSLEKPGLMLVDFLGGSPFNAAALYFQRTASGDVVSGVNIPMLLNVLMERDEVSDISQLALLAKQSGCEGISCLSRDITLAAEEEL